MICFLALIVFGILGIFSASHRKIALEAFDCVFRKMTLRKCHTGLDLRLKSSIIGKFIENHPRSAQIIYHNFEFLSWTFTLLLIVSMAWSAYSGYNYYLYGNCNGPSVDDQQGLCLFDPTGEHSQITKADQALSCSAEDIEEQISGTDPTLKDVDLSLFPTYSPKEIKDQLVYVGCYTCPNTRKVNSVINELVAKNKDTLKLIFVHLPLHQEYEYTSLIEDCLYQENPNEFWQFHNALMQAPIEDIKDKENVLQILKEIKKDETEKVMACTESEQAKILFEKQLNEIKKMNLEGTPTIFINDQVFIGPKQLRVYQRQLSTNIDWFGYGLIGLVALIILMMAYYAVFKRD